MKIRVPALAMALVAVAAAPALAQDDFSAVEIKAEKVADGIYMLTGQGGNLGLSVGADGAYLIDDQYAPLTGKILAEGAVPSGAPSAFLLLLPYQSFLICRRRPV